MTRDKQGGSFNSLVRTVGNAPKTCNIGYSRRSNLHENVRIPQNHKSYYNRTNFNKRKNVRFCKLSHIKRHLPICKYYRLGICHGGETGTENGFICKFAHPKLCKKFCEYGHDHKLGCTKSRKCSYYHPKICREAWRFGKCFNTKCPLRHLKTTNQKIDSIAESEIQENVEKTDKNSTKPQEITIDTAYNKLRSESNKTNVKTCLIVENKTIKSDLIDINKKNKPETDLVGSNFDKSEILKRFSKLTEYRDQKSICKPINHNFFEIIRQIYLNSFYSAATLFMQTIIKIRL